MEYLTTDESTKKAEEEKRKEIERLRIEQERIAQLVSKMNLKNTINLRIGQGFTQVQEILLDPASVSSNGDETVWHFKLFEFPDSNSKVFPFLVVFKKDRVVRFGVDQEQLERNRANVIIQKDMATNSPKKLD